MKKGVRPQFPTDADRMAVRAFMKRVEAEGLAALKRLPEQCQEHRVMSLIVESVRAADMELGLHIRGDIDHMLRVRSRPTERLC